MRYRLPAILVGALAFGIAGASPAQQGAPARGEKPADKPVAAPAKPPQPPQSIVGKDVVNADGRKLGTVKMIVGTQVIVSITDLADTSDRDVALPWAQLSPVGSGEKVRLRTKLTMDQLKALMPSRGSLLIGDPGSPAR